MLNCKCKAASAAPEEENVTQAHRRQMPPCHVSQFGIAASVQNRGRSVLYSQKQKHFQDRPT